MQPAGECPNDRAVGGMLERNGAAQWPPEPPPLPSGGLLEESRPTKSVTRRSLLLQPRHHFGEQPANPAPRTVSKSHALGKPARQFQAGNVCIRVEDESTQFLLRD